MEKTMKWSAILVVPAVVLIVACSRDSASNTDTLTATADTSTMSVKPADSPAPITAGSGGNMMDPNAARAAEVSSIPDVTPEVASASTAGRPYTNDVALDRVLAPTALTEQQRDSVYSRLWTPIDLNAATDEEILLIPGVGSRMLHEFK